MTAETTRLKEGFDVATGESCLDVMHGCDRMRAGDRRIPVRSKNSEAAGKSRIMVTSGI
jgi:hypothetical protein